MSTSSTLSIVQAFYQAGIEGDQAAFFGLLAPDVVLREPNYLPYGGTYQGTEQFGPVFIEVNKYLDLSTVTIDKIVVDGSRAVAFLRVETRASGAQVRIAEAVEIVGGKVAEISIFFQDTADLPLQGTT